jgi:hypothetical protein
MEKSHDKSLIAGSFDHFGVHIIMFQVVGAGLGRTGTDSLRAALEILGYRTYHHMAINDVRHHALWEKVYETRGTCAKSIDAALDAVVEGGYNATTDFPVSAFLQFPEPTGPTYIHIYMHAYMYTWTSCVCAFCACVRFFFWEAKFIG